MAGLYYQPVGLPSLGGATQTSSRAADLISTGLSGLGDKITGLGDRRQRRLDEEQARKNARGLEILQLAAANATSEAELDSIAGQLGLLPGGSVKDAIVIPGSAAVIDARRSAIIGDDKGRGDARTSLANAGLKETELTDAQRDSAAAANLADAQKVYAEDLAKLQGMSFANQEGYDAFAIDLNNRMAKSHGITANDIFGEAETNRTLKDTTDTTLSTNALTRTTNTTAALESVGGRALTAANQRRDLASTEQGIADDARQAKEAEERRYVDQLIAGQRLNGVTEYTQREAIMSDPNISDASKEYALKQLREGDSLDVTNPIQDITAITAPPAAQVAPMENVKNMVLNAFDGGERPTNEGRSLPIPQVASYIQGAVKTEIDRDPDLRTFEAARRFEQNPEFQDYIGDTGLLARKAFPDVNFSDDEVRQINGIKRDTGLTDAEIMALIGQSVNIESKWFFKDNLKDGRFRKKALAYKDGKDDIKVRYDELQVDATNAATLDSQISKLKRDQQRAFEAGNQKEVDRLEGQIGVFSQRLRRSQDELNARLGQKPR